MSLMYLNNVSMSNDEFKRMSASFTHPFLKGGLGWDANWEMVSLLDGLSALR